MRLELLSSVKPFPICGELSRVSMVCEIFKECCFFFPCLSRDFNPDLLSPSQALYLLFYYTIWVQL